LCLQNLFQPADSAQDAMNNEAKTTEPRLDAELLQRLVTLEMPFGKYKGRVLADLPGNYLHWFARQGFPPGEIGRLLALMHEIDHNGLKHLLQPLRNQR
jgi:uncharacterized protein